jgi:hypothetical protein
MQGGAEYREKGSCKDWDKRVEWQLRVWLCVHGKRMVREREIVCCVHGLLGFDGEIQSVCGRLINNNKSATILTSKTLWSCPVCTSLSLEAFRL